MESQQRKWVLMQPLVQQLDLLLVLQVHNLEFHQVALLNQERLLSQCYQVEEGSPIMELQLELEEEQVEEGSPIMVLQLELEEEPESPLQREVTKVAHILLVLEAQLRDPNQAMVTWEQA